MNTQRKRQNLPGIFTVMLALLAARPGPAQHEPRTQDYFAIQVVDDQTGRGVPMVELKTTSALCYYTDSAGCAAFYEPGLMNRVVWFGIASQGYEFPADAFGQRGVKLKTVPGTTVQVKIKRLNIAERLYRITGEGIYRDTVLLGHRPPLAEPLLNAEITGQDGVLTTFYRDKLYWFYGDTLRASYSLGNYSMTGATSDLPDKINPATGFELHYFTNQDGFARPMAPLKGEGVVWLSGLVTLRDKSGEEHMLAYYERRRGMGAVLENGFVMYDDETGRFEKFNDLPLMPPFRPQGYPFFVINEQGVKYIYFTTPYPDLRVKADLGSYLNLSGYESYTCLRPGGGLDRDAGGRLVWAWKRNVPPLAPKKQEEFIKAGLMKRADSPWRLEDAATGKPVQLSNCSCNWNEYRHRYIMIASEAFGATMLGEVWFSEAARPEGPWVSARKIITHANKPDDAHDFYNPTQHPFFDQDHGRIIYLEGSYVNTFSGNHQTTPLYEYNQIMYRLDLSDARLE